MGSGLIWFSEELRVQRYHFSRIDLLYGVRISTQALKFPWVAKKKSFQLSFILWSKRRALMRGFQIWPQILNQITFEPFLVKKVEN